MSRRLLSVSVRTILLPLAIALAAMVAVVVTAYLVDTGGEPRTLRGVTLEDRPAGNLTADELDRVVERLAADLASEPVEINLPGGTQSITRTELGVVLDIVDARTRALQAGKAGGTLDRFSAWVASFTTRTTIPTRSTIDEAVATERVSRIEPLVIVEPVEPSLVLTSERTLGIRRGSDGTQVDQQAIVDRLVNQVAAGGPYRIDAPILVLAPLTTDGELEELADHLNALTEEGITILLEEEERNILAEALRVRIDTVATENELAPVFDLDSLQALIEHVFGDIVVGGEDPAFDIIDDRPVVLEEGTPPMRCCAPGSAEIVAEAVLSGRSGPIEVEATLSDDPRHVLWATGEEVVEKVSEFTTNHSCCEARVGNIQRFADLVRGAYLRPGESMSLNDHVGERTRENGFVPAGTIIQGHLVSTVGGGVSQFATTMFNAAFLAGFDFEAYQSHSIYFSRYPYGREATISWPLPDLEFTNTTDHPALIWTSYDGTSITVSIYSTPSVEVEQTHQEVSSVRRCTRVDTYRSRTYNDGREIEDSVFAVYRPGEGLDCNGNPTTRPNT